jgi:hypothetical protein
MGLRGKIAFRVFGFAVVLISSNPDNGLSNQIR